MSKKPKIDKRLDKLFKGITPEESDSKSKDNLKVRKEAPLPSAEFFDAPQRPRPTTCSAKKLKTVSSAQAAQAAYVT